MTLDEVLKAHVLRTLSESKSKAEACRKLKISIRTLRNYLHAWKLTYLLGHNASESNREAILNCMKNLTPNQRDWIENREENLLLSKEIK